jgi:hypothetical protein
MYRSKTLPQWPNPHGIGLYYRLPHDPAQDYDVSNIILEPAPEAGPAKDGDAVAPGSPPPKPEG